VQAELQAALGVRLGELAEGLRVLRLSEDQLQTKERLAASRQLLTAEKDALLTALRVGQLGQASYEALVAEVDGRLLELERPAPERSRG
jgi:hypothetical protein